MKNIEKFFDEFCGGLMCEPYERKKNIKLECEGIPCSECPYKKIIIDWLLEEYKEPIQLTQFEYDLLGLYSYGKSSSGFDFFNTLRSMKRKGYFKNIDEDMEINDILNNCEVINNE